MNDDDNPTPTPRADDLLRRLEEGAPSSYRALVKLNEGSIALAAHQIAWLRNARGGYAKPTPSEHDLDVAAREIVARADEPEWTAAPGKTLAAECRLRGLDVLP